MRNVYNTENKTELDLFLTESMQRVQLDTCLQPADIGELLQIYALIKFFEISPAENNTTVSVFNEMKPKHFQLIFRQVILHVPCQKNEMKN